MAPDITVFDCNRWIVYKTLFAKCGCDEMNVGLQSYQQMVSGNRVLLNLEWIRPHKTLFFFTLFS